MVEETLNRIEQEIVENDLLDDQKKQELRDLLAQLRVEILKLNTTNSSEAASIANYAETSFREAIRREKSTELLRHSVEGLSISARKFEITHPTLTGIINNIGQTLVNIGI
ncbi:hypothetical protein CHISP_0748 [Chitinispirillum alkaliphilum]|nr:hypothetical protein CHISP_0748 [Chitinispirillum alkaliphilum]